MTISQKIAAAVRHPQMLWITGTGTMVGWFIASVVFHKGGFVHVALICAICCYLIQFFQNLRTREYRQSLDR